MGSAGCCAAAMVAALGLGGCGGSADGNGGSAGARGAPPDNHATPVPSDSNHPPSAASTSAPPCPPTGAWTECHVIDRLERAGLVVTKLQDPAREPPLQRQGTTLDVRNASLEVYIYPDVSARERDERRLDREKYLGADQPPGPVHKPTLVTSANLLVVLDTRRERQRERITLTLTAGPPQPPAP